MDAVINTHGDTVFIGECAGGNGVSRLVNESMVSWCSHLELEEGGSTYVYAT